MSSVDLFTLSLVTILLSGCSMFMSDDEWMVKNNIKPLYPPMPDSILNKYRAQIGQPVSDAAQALRLGHPKSNYSLANGGQHYMWDFTSYYTINTTEQVSNGQQCTSRIIGMTPAGNGVASTPIFENSCAAITKEVPVQKQGAGLPCFISAETDKNDKIIMFDLGSCGGPRDIR